MKEQAPASPWYDRVDGLPHPRWRTFYLNLRKQFSAQQRSESLAGFCGHWLHELAKALGPPYVDWDSDEVYLLSPHQDPKVARIVLDPCADREDVDFD